MIGELRLHDDTPGLCTYSGRLLSVPSGRDEVRANSRNAKYLKVDRTSFVCSGEFCWNKTSTAPPSSIV